MWRIVEGADEREFPRWTAMMAESEAIARIDEAEVAHERAREERFSAWLAQPRKP